MKKMSSVTEGKHRFQIFDWLSDQNSQLTVSQSEYKNMSTNVPCS